MRLNVLAAAVMAVAVVVAELTWVGAVTMATIVIGRQAATAVVAGMGQG